MLASISRYSNFLNPVSFSSVLVVLESEKHFQSVFSYFLQIIEAMIHKLFIEIVQILHFSEWHL